MSCPAFSAPPSIIRLLNSLKHSLHRLILLLIVFIKLVSINNIELVKSCQECFCFDLPNVQLSKRVEKIVTRLYSVPKKLWSRTLAITLSNLNRFQKFLHSCKEKEISNKPPPYLRYVATLPCEIQQFETDTNYTQNTIKCPHI